MNDSPIHVWKKNSREEVRGSIGEFNGMRIGDIRVYVNGDDGAFPTKKGISVRVEQLPQLRATVDALIAAAEHARPVAA